ncbi:Arc family DNA-binding protein [Falsochrobactrum shanghaiense]|nr:Arc family DNA-binding protein [Falsochrobactrum shanghaiense]
MSASRPIAFSGGKLHSLRMNEKTKYPSELAERFQIRLPPGLRDRIKVYAEAHGRSMNTEIVRILEREFPEPWDMTGRVNELVEMLKAVKAGDQNDDNVQRIAMLIEETINGIVSGRIRGVDEHARNAIGTTWGEYQMDLAQNNDFNTSLDPEEAESLHHSGTTAKYVWPDGTIGPKPDDPFGSSERVSTRNPKDYDDPDFPD